MEEFRYNIQNPKEFKRVYNLCKNIIENYPSQSKRSKIIIYINATMFVVNYCASIYGIYSHNWIMITLFSLLSAYQLWIVSVGFKQFQVEANLLKLAKEKKEFFDFVISMNSSPNENYKKSRDPFE